MRKFRAEVRPDVYVVRYLQSLKVGQENMPIKQACIEITWLSTGYDSFSIGRADYCRLA